MDNHDLKNTPRRNHTRSLAVQFVQLTPPGGCTVPCCLAIEGGSMVQKKTGSGISTPASRRLPVPPTDLFFSPASLPARRAAATAEAFDDTMVSPVALYRSTREVMWKKNTTYPKPQTQNVYQSWLVTW